MTISLKKVLTVLPLLCAITVAQEIKFEPLPSPVTNNAVTGFKAHGDILLFSFMGVGPKKTADAITVDSYSLDLEAAKWSTIRPVPGTAGRIAAAAIEARDNVFLFGGYVIDSHGAGMAVPDVNAYDPVTDRWFRAADIPVPVGDAVIGSYQDRFVYLIGGRSNKGPVTDVQIYDSEKNKWSSGTPMAGSAVFGHAGGMVGNTIVYVGGATQTIGGGSKYAPTDECWMGKIDHHDRTKITWTKLPPHPGSANFRIAAGASEKHQMIYFSGGTDNPYDMSGVGYDGKPAEPSPVTFAFNAHTGKWETVNENTPDPTMDHRGLVATSEGLVVAGGMAKGQQVTAKVVMIDKVTKAAPPEKNSKAAPNKNSKDKDQGK